jgi:hypothetical protein
VTNLYFFPVHGKIMMKQQPAALRVFIANSGGKLCAKLNRLERVDDGPKKQSKGRPAAQNASAKARARPRAATMKMHSPFSRVMTINS